MISSAPILTVSAVFDIMLSLIMFCAVAVGFFFGCSWYLNYFQVMGITLGVQWDYCDLSVPIVLLRRLRACFFKKKN